jgi:hypothetical protein
MTSIAEIFVGLLLAVAILAMLARKLHIPYPILFVVGGLLLGSIHGLPQVRLNPELVFLFFLPPLLFPAALFTSWRDFRANLRPISLLATKEQGGGVGRVKRAPSYFRIKAEKFDQVGAIGFGGVILVFLPIFQWPYR